MELTEAKLRSEPYPQWLRLPIPQSPPHLEYSPSIVLPSKHLSIYVDQNNLHHPSMNIWTPASSTDLSDDHIAIGMFRPSSQVLEQIEHTDSDSFGSAEEMFKSRDEQSSTRDYSLRQTYSFLSEMSSSGPQNGPLPLSSLRKQRTRAKPSPEITPPADITWSHSSREMAEKHTDYPQRGRPPSDDARKASLNKNKAAAAKCRINKNIQSDKLRESAHTVLAANQRLRQEVMDKMEEIQVLHTEILCHAVANGCKDPQHLREYLCAEDADAAETPTTAGGRRNSRADACADHRPIPPAAAAAAAALARRRSDAPAAGINRYRHGSTAHRRAERRLRTQLSEP